MSKYSPHSDNQRPLAKRLAGPFLLISILFYMAFHAVSGEHGVFALFHDSRRLETLKAELAEVKANREALDRKARHLSDASLDLDLLDEQSRRVLGKADKDEVVLFTDK